MQIENMSTIDVMGIKYYLFDDMLKMLCLNIEKKKIKHYLKPSLNEVICINGSDFVSENYIKKIGKRYNCTVVKVIGGIDTTIHTLTVNFSVRDFTPWASDKSRLNISGRPGQFTDQQTECRKEGFKRIIDAMMSYISPETSPYVKGMNRDILFAQYLAGIRVKYFPEIS